MLSNKRLVTVCAILLCCNIAWMVLFVEINKGKECYVSIDEQQVVLNLPENFLSFGIDTSEVEFYDKVDFGSEKLRRLAAALSPARLRLGGTMSERLIFSPEGVPLSCEYCSHAAANNTLCDDINRFCRHKPHPFFILSGRKLTDIYMFCKAAGLNLLFSFNVLLRNDQNEWSEQNALEILKYATTTFNSSNDIDWQLGNEPNSFHHVFGVTITPQMLAKDFKKLRWLLNHNGYRRSLLVGPDTTRPQPKRPECIKYMVDFLGNNSRSISVRSWHQYYLNGREAQLEDFWNPDTLDLLKEQIDTMKNNTEKYNNIPMWLTETSSAYGGGAPGLSNSYAGSPLWIDKLGLSSKHNVTTVVRQSFIGGNYSLITKDLEPLPDWWISVLYKKLVGNKVLHIDCHCSRFQRMYAHCANRKYTNDTTAVTLYGVNLKLAKAQFLLNGTALHGDNLTIDEYIISAPKNNRRTTTINLNGRPIHYDTHYNNLKPKRLKYGNHIYMPPYSIGFWVIKNTSIQVCK